MVSNLITEPGLSSPNIREVHRQSTTLERILGDEKPQIEDPLKLLTATVDVRVFESPDTLYYRVSFPETLLSGEDFIQLLTYARPNRSKLTRSGTQNKDDILSDWETLTRKPTSDLELLRGHEGTFGHYWSELMDHHVNHFMAAVRSLTQDEINNFFDQMEFTVISGKKFKSILRYDLELEPIVTFFLDDPTHSIKPFYVGNLLCIDKLGSSEMDLRRLQSLAYRVLVVDTRGLGSMSVSETYLGTVYSINHQGNGNVKIIVQDSWMRGHVREGYFEEEERFVAPALTPSLIWRRTKEGIGMYLTSKIPSALSNGQKSNPLLGLAAASYLSPQQRDQLPHQLSYKEAKYIARIAHSARTFSELNAKLGAELDPNDIGRRQQILEAQMPLLLLMYANILLNEIPLFPKVESLYSK